MATAFPCSCTCWLVRRERLCGPRSRPICPWRKWRSADVCGKSVCLQEPPTPLQVRIPVIEQVARSPADVQGHIVSPPRQCALPLLENPDRLRGHLHQRSGLPVHRVASAGDVAVFARTATADRSRRTISSDDISARRHLGTGRCLRRIGRRFCPRLP
jgi:hypothetical protein